MKSDGNLVLAAGQSIIATFLVPGLWPMAWIASIRFFPGSIDPLLGGMENSLYIPALIWLLLILSGTLLLSRMFRLGVSNILFLTTGLGGALLVSTILNVWMAWDTYRLIGQKSVVYPKHFDVAAHLLNFVYMSAFLMAVTLLTTGVFVLVGGFRVWKSRKGAAPV